MKDVRHNIKVYLYESFLTNNPSDLTAKVISERTLNIAEICRTAVGRGGALAICTQFSGGALLKEPRMTVYDKIFTVA